MAIHFTLSDNYKILLREIKCPNKGRNRPHPQIGRLVIVRYEFSLNNL